MPRQPAVHHPRIAVIGLGYVGLPLAVAHREFQQLTTAPCTY